MRLILEEIVAPVIRYGFEVGTDKLLAYLSDKGIPAAKKTVKLFAQNAKNNIEAVRDGLLGKETKASQILRETQTNKSTELVDAEKLEEQDFYKE
ncbi:MAG: hypothetical protein LBM60_04940, partial [Clostridium sp.]|nr:hypothetical protein [Clostridium sp.]